MKGTIVGAAAASLALIGLAWALTSGGGARIGAQLRLAADSGGGPDPNGWGVMRTGISQGRYGSPCTSVPGAVTGPHPLKNHPISCSPNLSSVMAQGYDWMFNPPSEGDL